MEENISERSGFVRLALGVGLTACGTAHLARESGNRSLGALYLAAGAMKVAEGIFLYCPMKALINSNVKQEIANTFDEYMDGDSVMHAYNDFYTEKWGAGSSDSSNSSSGSAGASAMQNTAKGASQVAQAVSKATPSGTVANTVSQATKAAADALSGNQNNQSQNNQNNQSNNNQNSSSQNQQNKSSNAKSGQSAQNPS